MLLYLGLGNDVFAWALLRDQNGTEGLWHLWQGARTVILLFLMEQLTSGLVTSNANLANSSLFLMEIHTHWNISHKKERNNAICSNMVRPRDCHTK